MKFQLVTQYWNKKNYKNLKQFAAAGSDRIQSRIVEDNCDQLLTPITYLVILNMSTGIFPSLYKEAIIRPIYNKEGDEKDINNYKQISLISNISKIIETAVKHQLVKCLEDSDYFVESQLGFRKNKWELKMQ